MSCSYCFAAPKWDHNEDNMGEFDILVCGLIHTG